jgi:hypothetical protein
MTRLRTVLALTIAGAVAIAPIASAQRGEAAPGGRQTPSQIGEILSIDGPDGSVIVVRGAQAYALVKGDLLFRGDRIVTRTNGTVTFAAEGCEKSLAPTASIVLDDAICKAAPVTLAEADPVVPPPPAGAPIAVGATTFALPGLLAAGAGAAALTGSQSTSSVQP